MNRGIHRLRNSGSSIFRRLTLPRLRTKASTSWAAMQDTYLSTKDIFERHKVVFTVSTSIASVLTAWLDTSFLFTGQNRQQTISVKSIEETSKNRQEKYHIFSSSMDSKSLRFIVHQSFFSAVRSDDFEALKNIVEDEGSDPAALMALQNDAQETALYIAAESNLDGVFSYLLGFCDLQIAMIKPKADMNAFHVAAARGHLEEYGRNVQKHDDGSISMETALPPLPRFANGTIAMPMAAEAANTTAMASRKPPLPLQLVQPKAGDAQAGGYSLPSPDSVASDSSIRSGASSTKYVVYPEGNPTGNTENQVSDAAFMETQNNIPATSSHIQYQLVHESMAPFLQQQQQLIQPTLHYIQHPPTNPQMPSYYPMYVPSPSQAFHQTLDQQYQTYVLQAPKGQQYHLAVQPNNIPDNSTTPPPNQSAIPSSTTYNEIRPPVYPGQPTNYYRATTTPTLINVPSAQFQQQYFNNPQMQQPPAQPAVPANSSTAGYAYEYANQMNDQAYYGQHLTTPIAQYQTMGNQVAAAMYT